MSITRFQLEQMQARLGRPTVPDAPPLEKALHRKIMDHCDKQWPRWKYVRSRMDKPTGQEIGVADFIIFMPCMRVLLVEAKRPGQKPTLAQSGWHAELAKLGFTVDVVHDMKEFLLAVEAAKNRVGQSMSSPPPT